MQRNAGFEKQEPTASPALLSNLIISLTLLNQQAAHASSTKHYQKGKTKKHVELHFEKHIIVFQIA